MILIYFNSISISLYFLKGGRAMIINNNIVPKGSDVETVLKTPTLFDLASNSVKEEVIRRRPDLIQYAKRPSEALQMLAMASGDDIYQYINHPTEKVKLYAALINGEDNIILDIHSVLKVLDIITDQDNSISVSDVPEDEQMTEDGKRVCINTIEYAVSLLLKTKTCGKWELFKTIWRMIFRKTPKAN
jgi:hypothetical protein